MRKTLFIAIIVYLFFLAEFFLFNIGGRWFTPNLLLILVIYINLAFGIRYSIVTAVLAGLLQDCFGVGFFGANMFVFLICAYMTTYLKKYLHYVASRQSRLLMVFLITVVHVAASAMLHMRLGRTDAAGIFGSVFVPQIITTLIVTSFVFTQLKRCVLRLFA